MPPQTKKVIGAMFDVKPVDATGQIDFAKIESIQEEINLRPKKEKKPKFIPPQAARAPMPKQKNVAQSVAAGTSIEKEKFLQELNSYLKPDTKVSLASLVSPDTTVAKPRYRPVVQKNTQDRQHKMILAAIGQKISRAVEPEPEPEEQEKIIPAPVMPEVKPETAQAVEQFYITQEKARIISQKPKSKWKFKWSKKLTILAIAVSLASSGAYALSLKGKVIQDGTAAIGNLQDAKANLEHMDFAAASNNFSLAYDSFSQAEQKLNFLGASISGLLANLPGGGKLKSAQNLVKVGQLIASSGQAMAKVVDVIAKTRGILNPDSSAHSFSSEILLPLKKALVDGEDNLTSAQDLLSQIDSSIIPDDKRPLFDEFKDKLPQLKALIAMGTEYEGFLEGLAGSSDPKKYLILFENASELRPTGGFPGTYGIMTVQNGSIKSFSVDDVYNLDGQLKELIVPPVQLQHITPTWGMRDVNWFVDFPTSAKKVMEYFNKEAGYNVDGVITINPAVMSNILKVIGPIALPSYNLVLDDTNFLTSLQSQVEYGPDKKDNQPKKVVTEFAPLVFAKLSAADKDTWLKIYNVLMAGMAEKDILLYFKDRQLEDFVTSKDFSGEVKQTPDDYLMVALSNVKGSKTDAVTESTFQVQASIEGGLVHHTLTITRQHNGGKSQYGFYNKQNSDYVRVLVPAGAKLDNITGISKPNYQPLMNYAKSGFSIDPDLAALEKNMNLSSSGVSVGTESGHAEFGLWMNVDPGETKKITIQYTTPVGVSNGVYNMYVQKQPGVESHFTFDMADLGAHYDTIMTKDLPLQLHLQSAQK